MNFGVRSSDCGLKTRNPKSEIRNPKSEIQNGWIMPQLRTLITSTLSSVRDQSLDAVCRPLPLADLLAECADLEVFRRGCDNLYERVRALFFLAAIHRFHLPARPELPASGHVPFQGYECLLSRRFDEAVSLFLAEQESARAQRRPFKRPGTGLSRSGVSNARQPGAEASAAFVAINGCSASVIRPITRCASAANCSSASGPRAPSRSSRADPRAHGFDPSAPGATFSFSAWITPKAPACSTCPSISAFSHRAPGTRGTSSPKSRTRISPG